MILMRGLSSTMILNGDIGDYDIVSNTSLRDYETAFSQDLLSKTPSGIKK